jgi:hypothetical protein
VAQGVGPEFKPQYCKKKERKKMRYIYTMSFEEKWIELEIVILSKISQTPKAKYSMILLICGM